MPLTPAELRIEILKAVRRWQRGEVLSAAEGEVGEPLRCDPVREILILAEFVGHPGVDLKTAEIELQELVDRGYVQRETGVDATFNVVSGDFIESMKDGLRTGSEVHFRRPDEAVVHITGLTPISVPGPEYFPALATITGLTLATFTRLTPILLPEPGSFPPMATVTVLDGGTKTTAEFQVTSLGFDGPELRLTPTGIDLLDGAPAPQKPKKLPELVSGGATGQDTSEADSKAGRKRRMTKAEANIGARHHLKDNPGITRDELAKAIGCSTGLVCKLPAWKAVQEERGKGRKPKKPKTVSLTRKLEGAIGDADAELQRLTAEQKADDEPPPNIPHSTPRRIRTRQRP